MKRNLAIILIALASSVAAAQNDSLIAALKKQYEQRVIVPRSALQHGDQEFDSSGRPLKDPPTKEWRVYGPVLVQKVTFGSAELQLQGSRIAFAFRKEQNDKIPVPLGKPIKIRIRLAHALRSAEEIQEILNRVFFSDTESSDYSRPTYCRPDQKIPSDETIYNVQKDDLTVPAPKYTPAPNHRPDPGEKYYRKTVVLRAVIDKAGAVSRIVLDGPVGKGLDEDAVNTVKKWRFQPATRQGQPVATEIMVEVQFSWSPYVGLLPAVPFSDPTLLSQSSSRPEAPEP